MSPWKMTAAARFWNSISPCLIVDRTGEPPRRLCDLALHCCRSELAREKLDDTAFIQAKRGGLRFFASKLAPTA
ncbi:hypothetical protein FHP26_00790 [Pseudomonas orientalis]|nr:hypothetical protein [Pseudomonas orientalis]